VKIGRHLGGDTIILTLTGNFDETTSPDVEKEIEKDLCKDEIKGIFFDLSGVDYISSSGIRVMIVAYKRAIKCGKKVMIKDMSEKVREILDTTGVLPLFTD